MKRMKKILASVLLIATLCCLMSSCGGSSYTDEELIAQFKEKYALSYTLNEYIWGSGLPAGEINAEVTLDPYYVKVSEQAEYQTKAEFIAAIQNVYVSEFVEKEIKTLLFIGNADEEISPRYGEIDGILSINVRENGIKAVGDGKFLPDTARVKKARGNTVIFTVTYDNGMDQKDYDIMMRMDGDQWKFESPTY